MTTAFCLVQRAAKAAPARMKAKAAKKAKAEEAAAAKVEAKAAKASLTEQRYQYLKEKKAAQGKLSGAESKEYIKMQDAFNAKRRRKAESPEVREARISKMRKIK